MFFSWVSGPCRHLMALNSLTWALHPNPMPVGTGAPFRQAWCAGLQLSYTCVQLAIDLLDLHPDLTGFSACHVAMALPGNHWTWPWLADRLPSLTLDLPHHYEFVWWSGLLVEPGHNLCASPVHLAQVLWGGPWPLEASALPTVLLCSAPGSPSFSEQPALAAPWQWLSKAFTLFTPFLPSPIIKHAA